MKKCLIAVAWLMYVAVQSVGAADILRPGQDIDQVTKVLRDYGYKETGLEMGTVNTETDLKFWAVGEGVLILTFSAKNGKVSEMTLWLCDERAKSTRKEFSFQVTEFDPKTRQIRITLPNTPAQSTGKPAPGR
jgi:hypothetical protein